MLYAFTPWAFIPPRHIAVSQLISETLVRFEAVRAGKSRGHPPLPPPLQATVGEALV